MGYGEFFYCAGYPGANDSHTALEVTFFKDAEGIYIIGDKEYDFKAGDIFLMTSFTNHRIKKVTKSGVVCNISFEPRFIWSAGSDFFDVKYLRVFFDKSMNFEYRLDRNNPAIKKIRKLVLDIGQEFAEKKHGYEHVAKAYLLTILVNIMREFDYLSGDSENVALEKMNISAIGKTMDFINQHLSEEIKLDTLAKIANLSPSYYGMLFKSFNGLSPVEYIIAKRVEKATKLLCKTDSSILDIGLSCGFNNSVSFNRTFKKVTGTTPSEYRKNKDNVFIDLNV